MSLVTAAIVLVSAIVQSMTGFGFAVLAVPLFALFWKPIDAVAISFILSTLCVVLLWQKVRRADRLPIVRPLFVAALVGLPFGIWALQRIDLHVLRLAIGIVTLATVGIFGFASIRREPASPAATPSTPLSLATGLVAGLLTGALSMPGPPVVMLLTGCGASKASYRGTLTAFAILIYPVGLVALIVERLITPAAMWQAFLQVPVLVLGIGLGNILHNAVSERLFARMSLVLLALAGAVCFIPR